MDEQTDPSKPTVQQRVGDRYQLTQLLCNGGMSQIYLAEDTRLFQRQVVVKLLSVRASKTDHQLREWFANEAQISVMLGDHPRIVTVLDYGLDRERPYLVMEYLGRPPKGCDLAEYLKTNKCLSPEQVIKLGSQICSGLAHAHQFKAHYNNQSIQGVIHRDLKPNNVFIIRQDILGETIKILDFGISKILSDVKQKTESKVVFAGTPAFASPEQMRGEKLTPSSDIYSLGIILYRMLAGVMPLRPPTSSFKDWYIAHTQLDPLPFNSDVSASVPQPLTDVVMSCLEKDPKDRPESMLTLMRALEMSTETASKRLQRPLKNSSKSLCPDSPSVTGTSPSSTTVTLQFAPAPSVETITLPVKPISSRSSPPVLTLQAQLTPLLIRWIGPIAPLLIEEILNSNPSNSELIQALAETIPVRHRAQFWVQAHQILADLSSAAETQSISVSRVAVVTQITADDKERLTQKLSRLIGPIADLMVEQVLTVSPTMTYLELVDCLVKHIRVEAKAKQFEEEILSDLKMR